MNGLILASYVLKSHLGRIDPGPVTVGLRGQVARAAGLLSIAVIVVAIVALGGTA